MYFFIGDKFKDYQAAEAAGCKFILVKTGYGAEMLEKHPELKEGILVADDLQQAIKNQVLHDLHVRDKNRS